MGIGPAPAIEKLLKASGKQLSDIDLVEVMFTHNHGHVGEHKLILQTGSQNIS
jgi:hypothetical protein